MPVATRRWPGTDFVVTDPLRARPVPVFLDRVTACLLRSPGPRVAGLSLLVGGLCIGCAHSTVARPARVALLPLEGIGVAQGDVSRMDRTIVRQIEQVVDVPVVDRSRVQGQTATMAVCRDRSGERAIPCGAEVGRAVGASHVVLGAVGQLGKTWVLRLKLLRVDESTVTRTVEETLFGDAGLDRSVARVTQQLFDLPRRGRWYSRWWVWTLVGIGVTAAVVVPVVLTRGGDNPYHDIPLP